MKSKQEAQNRGPVSRDNRPDCTLRKLRTNHEHVPYQSSIRLDDPKEREVSPLPLCTGGSDTGREGYYAEEIQVDPNDSVFIAKAAHST